MGCTFCNLINFSNDNWEKIINKSPQKIRRTTAQKWQDKKEIAYDIAKNHPEMVTLIKAYSNTKTKF